MCTRPTYPLSGVPHGSSSFIQRNDKLVHGVHEVSPPVLIAVAPVILRPHNGDVDVRQKGAESFNRVMLQLPAEYVTFHVTGVHIFVCAIPQEVEHSHLVKQFDKYCIITPPTSNTQTNSLPLSLSLTHYT